MFEKPSIAKIIQILKEQKLSSPKNNWSELEDHVRYVYESLLEMEGNQVVVARDVKVRGKMGQLHQVDVYYEFEKAGIRHRVAIECKNTKRPIDKSKVGAFLLVLDDCPGMIGVMVSVGGYQDGAEKAATDHGILPLTLDDLPSLSYLLGMRLELAAIPDERTIGQPFWTIFELEHGKNIGVPYGQWHGNDAVSLLFFSKKSAEEFLIDHNLDGEWVVRGLSQTNLRSFILNVDAFAGKFTLCSSFFDESGKRQFGGLEISRADLIDEFYLDGKNIPDQPLVMPHLRKVKR